MSDGRIEYEITADSRGFANAAKSSEGELNKLAGAGRRMALSIKAAVASATAVAGTLGVALREAMKIETTETGITTLVKDASLAKAIVQDLKKLGAETPFEVGDLAGAARGLLGAGSSVKDLRSQLTMLGDIASGAQTNLGELVLVFNKIRGDGKLTGDTLGQLTDRGIGGIREEIAKVTGIPVEKLMDAVAKGQVPVEKMMEVFRNLTGAGGLYFRSMINQSATLEGRLSTLSDEFKALLRVPGEAGLGSAKRFVDALIEGTQKATRMASIMVKTIEVSAANGRLGEFLGLSLRLGMAKATMFFLQTMKAAVVSIGEALGKVLKAAFTADLDTLKNVVQNVIEVGPIGRIKDLLNIEGLEAEFAEFTKAGRASLESGLGDVAATMRDAMKGGAGEIKTAAGEIKSAADDMKEAKEGLRGDKDGDGIISKREQRKLDLEDKRAQRKANSLKGFSFAKAGLGQFGGLEEFFALQFRDGKDGTGFEGDRAFSAFGDRRRGVASAAQVGAASRAFARPDDERLPGRDSAFRNIGRAVEAGVSPGQRANDQTRNALAVVTNILQELRRINAQ
jgi:HAMP domain-containing protein